MATHEIDLETDKIAEQVVEAAFRVHRVLGPGLLENAYETCLVYEMGELNLKVKRQIDVPLVYGEVRLESGFRLDLLVEDKIVIEVKAVETTLPIHEAQILTYLKLTGNKLGFLINFNVRFLKDGLKRIVFTK
jgi:GxxExxY protein